MSGRAAAVVALGVLVAALVALVAATVPWSPLSAPPVPPGGRVAAPAVSSASTTEPSAGDFTPADVARADRYHAAVRPPAYLSLAVGCAVTLLLALTPWGARLVQVAGQPGGGGWWAQALAGGFGLALLIRLVTLPFDARAEAVSRAYGLSTRSWGGWLVDVTKGWALSAALLVGALTAALALARRWPGGWWLPAGAGGAALVVFVSFSYPLVVEPVFNRFTPLADGPLRQELLRIAARDDVTVSDVLVADASRRTTRVNAYVSGFGSTRRIVVYDTMLEKGSEEEIRLVVAHELGHAQRNDVLHGTVLGALGTAAGVCLLYLALQWTPLLRRAGASSAGDPRALAVMLAVATVLGAITGPAQQLISRRIETRADVHSLQLTRDPGGFAAMQRRLAVTNLSDLDPPPIVFGLFASHPTAPMRIALARRWAADAGLPVPGPLRTGGDRGG